mmetsp:Transcript_1076/g.2152  ORF Transcript_1076/g.2152 Transcript_1076/m.2152 type:complete len:307 (-) Transcript_1076:369-1289(-)
MRAASPKMLRISPWPSTGGWEEGRLRDRVKARATAGRPRALSHRGMKGAGETAVAVLVLSHRAANSRREVSRTRTTTRTPIQSNWFVESTGRHRKRRVPCTLGSMRTWLIRNRIQRCQQLTLRPASSCKGPGSGGRGRAVRVHGRGRPGRQGHDLAPHRWAVGGRRRVYGRGLSSLAETSARRRGGRRNGRLQLSPLPRRRTSTRARRSRRGYRRLWHSGLASRTKSTKSRLLGSGARRAGAAGRSVGRRVPRLLLRVRRPGPMKAVAMRWRALKSTRWRWRSKASPRNSSTRASERHLGGRRTRP